MSNALLTLAFKAAIPATPKFVLVALSDSANDQGECYPSVPTLMEKCSMSDRGVQKAIAELEAWGFLRREFRKGRSTVYWITPERGSPPNNVHPERRSPPNIVHPTPEQCSPITLREPSVEPSGNPKKPRAARSPSPACPEDVDGQTWDDWLALRTKKRAPVTATVIAEARREADKAGVTLSRFLAIWCAKGYQGMQADWIKPHERAGPPSAERGVRRGVPLSDAERDAANAAANAEAKRLLFGGKAQEVIDA